MRSEAASAAPAPAANSSGDPAIDELSRRARKGTAGWVGMAVVSGAPVRQGPEGLTYVGAAGTPYRHKLTELGAMVLIIMPAPGVDTSILAVSFEPEVTEAQVQGLTAEVARRAGALERRGARIEAVEAHFVDA